MSSYCQNSMIQFIQEVLIIQEFISALATDWARWLSGPGFIRKQLVQEKKNNDGFPNKAL